MEAKSSAVQNQRLTPLIINTDVDLDINVEIYIGKNRSTSPYLIGLITFHHPIDLLYSGR
jgi:hypothetical protein